MRVCVRIRKNAGKCGNLEHREVSAYAYKFTHLPLLLRQHLPSVSYGLLEDLQRKELGVAAGGLLQNERDACPGAWVLLELGECALCCLDLCMQ